MSAYDTSALIAILDQELEVERIARALASTWRRVLSAANLVELGIVLQARRGADGARGVDLLLDGGLGGAERAIPIPALPWTDSHQNNI